MGAGVHGIKQAKTGGLNAASFFYLSIFFPLRACLGALFRVMQRNPTVRPNVAALGMIGQLSDLLELLPKVGQQGIIYA